ncbi:MAG: hypothetical protein WAM42_16415, partial [Candidatus Nitrosopolaris sp.]
MTITREVREKVIQMHTEGRGRNEIARLINGQGLHISEGSVGNIIRAYRKCEDGISGVRSLQYGVVPNPEVVTSLASTGIDMNNTDGSPSSTARRYSGVGKGIDTNSSSVTPRDGSPLLRFLRPDTDVNFTTPSSESLEAQESDASVMNVNSQNETIEEEEFEQYHQSEPALPNSEDPSIVLGIDWDSDQVWERRFIHYVMDDKKQRQQQLQLIERRQQELDEQKRQIENIRQDLEARENKLRHLKDIGISFDQALVWVDCIKEVAQKERIDERTAAWKLADILRSFKDLSDLEKAIQQATQQLAMLNMVNDQQKRAITTLVNLQKMGM